MEFNFGSITAASSNKAWLKPWGIYPVKFTGTEKVEVQGKKDPTKTYQILKIRFEGNDGVYEESVFYPQPGDDVRPTYTNKEGHDFQAASKLERTMTVIAQTANALNPEGYKKMQSISSKFKTFDDVVKAFITITDKAIGKETHIKLVGVNRDGIVRPALPKLVAITKQGDSFTCDNYIGDNLFFSAYEESKKKEYENAKPDNIEALFTPSATEEKQEEKNDDDIDFESIL